MASKSEINHSSSVSSDISKLFLNEKLSDVLFVVEGKHIAAHKIVLAARSDTFRNILFDQTVLINCKREIHIKDISALSFKNFIKYIYTGMISLTDMEEKEIQEVLALALEYGMKELVECIVEPNRGQQKLSQQKTITNTNEESIANISDKKVKYFAKFNEEKKNQTPLQFEDLANVNNGAAVIEGLNPESLFSSRKDFDEKSLTKHKIEANTKGIIVKLNIPVIINVVKFRLCDRDPKRVYCYLVQVSADNRKWRKIADYRHFSCRSWQSIFFEQQLVQYIRIFGTYSNEKSIFSSNRYFTITSLLCGLTQRAPKLTDGFWEPESNIACLSKGAIVIINNGNDFCRNAKMINDYLEFEYKKYNNICSEFQFESDSQLIVQLSQPIITSSLSFYIYSEEKFKYTVKVSVDHIEKENKRWVLVADKRKQFNPPKWQKITFEKCKVLLISIGDMRCLDETVETFPILSFSCP